MRPSQQRQLIWWFRFWCKVGVLFLVTMGCMAIGVRSYREANGLNEAAQAPLRAAIASGQIQAVPLVSMGRLVPALTIDTRPPSTPPDGGGAATPAPPYPVLQTTPVLALTRSDSGVLTISSPCDAGVTYYLEASLDLRAWGTVSLTTPLGQSVAFAVSNNLSAGPVFYRLRGQVQIFVSPIRGEEFSGGADQSVVRSSKISRMRSAAKVRAE